MYGRNDLRASLAPPPNDRSPTAFKSASYAPFFDHVSDQCASDQDAKLTRHWYARGQTMVVCYSKVEAGAVLQRDDQCDEYAVVLPDDGVEVEVSNADSRQVASGRSVIFVPPGSSRIVVNKGGRLLRLFTTRSDDLLRLCSNADAYATPDGNVALFESWPEPVGGYSIRVYSGSVPPEEGRFGRLYRGSTIMVNFGDGRVGPRAPENLSPHHHADFEQYSIALDGDYIHHLRWPWISDSTQWKDDDHERCAAPSLAVIPPPATHTSQGVGLGLNRLLDAFCPPRRDFSLKPGWVLNADDYPMPELSGDSA